MPIIPTCIEELRTILQSESRLIIDLPEGFRRASVLIPLFYRDNRWFLIFTRRTERVHHHKNEISFPGGRHDENQDNDLIHTALRETKEELGIEGPKVIGLLDDLLTISNYVVTPVVGFIEDNNNIKNYKISTPEIEYVLEVPVLQLVIPENFSIEKLTYKDSYVLHVPFFDYQGEIIWGVTGRILVNLLKKFNLLDLKCRLTLMGEELWTRGSEVKDNLDYISKIRDLDEKK